MPRKARIDAPGALHHVIIQGIEGRKIFRSDYDRENFITRFAELIAEVMDISLAQVTVFGKPPQTVKARPLLCLWAQRRLGMSTVEIVKKLRIRQPAVSRSSKRGEQIENEHGFDLISIKV